MVPRSSLENNWIEAQKELILISDHFEQESRLFLQFFSSFAKDGVPVSTSLCILLQNTTKKTSEYYPWPF